MPDILLDNIGLLPIEVGHSIPDYPFAINGDLNTLVISRTYRQLAVAYRPGQVGILRDTRPSNAEPDVVYYPDAYLIAPERPQPTGIAGVIEFTRTFARIPVDQVTYGPSRYIDFPAVPDAPGTTADSVYTIDPTTGLADVTLGTGHLYLYNSIYYKWAPNNKFYGPLNTGVVTYVIPTGGTFTLTYKNSTTGALAYNEVDANIAAALDALADAVSDGITFTVFSYLSTAGPLEGSIEIGINGGTTTSPVTMDASNLTPTGANVAFTSVTNNVAQDIAVAALRTVTGHAFDPAEDLLVAPAGATYLLPPEQWAVLDANTVAYARNVIGPADLIASIETFVGQELRTYTPGLRLVRVRNTEKFYLPGVTAGITTGADIPVVAGMQTTNLLIDALLGATGFQTYLTEGPTQWRESPILVAKLIAINLEDVP